MTLSDFDYKRTEILTRKFIEKHRPSEDIRDKVDISFRIENQNVEIFEIRADWRDERNKIEAPVAKASFVKSTRKWKVFWQRSDLKWHRYQPLPEVNDITDFLRLLDEDKHNCFWG